MGNSLDNEIIRYDLARYPFAAWVQSRVEDAGYDASDLQKLHLTVPKDEVLALTKKVIRDTQRADYREMAHAFVREVLAPRLGVELALQRYVNMRIFLPYRPEMCIHFHNGYWYGHGPAETTVWMPVCATGGSASLQVIDLAPSRELSEQALLERWDHATMQREFMSRARAVEMVPGQVLLFQQEHLHGNAPVNDTGLTRVSFDMRVASKGGVLARKMVGGYFEPVDRPRPAPSAPLPAGDRSLVIGYVNNNTRHSSGVPIHVQRLMMREYCEPLHLRYTYEQLEIEAMPYLPILSNVLAHDRPRHLVVYSLYAMPDREEYRRPLFDDALRHGTTIHFANEDIAMSTEADRAYVEHVINFTRYQPLAEFARYPDGALTS